MAHFTSINGAFPSLQQIDKTCAVAAERMKKVEAREKIQRGSLIYVTADGTFDLASATQSTVPGALIYFALQDQDNYPAGMAGSVGTGPSKAINGFDDAGRAYDLIDIPQARVTGLACTMPMEFQTDCFDLSGDTPAIGMLLTVGDYGKLVPHATGKNVVAVLTALPFSRWVNDAVIAGVRRTGAQVTVINATTAWAPTVTIA